MINKDLIARILVAMRWNEKINAWEISEPVCFSQSEANELRDIIAEDAEEMDMDESMDGDHASALASAGFGTDEDYGCYDGAEDLGWDGGCED